MSVCAANLVENLRRVDGPVAADAMGPVAFAGKDLVLNVTGQLAGQKAGTDEFTDFRFCCWHTRFAGSGAAKPVSHYKLVSLCA